MSEVIDNRAERIRTLNRIIKHLHAGRPADEVKGELQQIVRQTDYSEIVAMEQELLAEGMPVEELRCMCDLHSEVTRDVLVQLPAKAVPPGHPVDTLRRENEALRGAVAAMRSAAAELVALPEDADAEAVLLRRRQAFNDLTDIEKHYQRKEHALFSCLERHGISGPSKVMWAKHDEIRGLLKELGAALGKRDASVGDAALKMIEEMFYKEENILIPMCLDAFTEDDWAEVWNASPTYGWCLVEPRPGYRPAVAASAEISAADIRLPSGSLTLDQLTALFATLPVDLTFVDAEDRVRFFSEGPDRIFSRSKAILGRKVQNCHPPRSVDVVDRILSDFREGRRDVAEFWINFQGRFVHIRYFAVRGPERRYEGTLEVTQDLTKLRALEGERRLLEYEDVAEAPRDGVPEWLKESRIRLEIDADAMLKTGEHPIGLIRRRLTEVEAGDIIRLTSSFHPAPLIEALSRAGAAVYSAATADGDHSTYICRMA